MLQRAVRPEVTNFWDTDQITAHLPCNGELIDCQPRVEEHST